jgi:hypothetical protein
MPPSALAWSSWPSNSSRKSTPSEGTRITPPATTATITATKTLAFVAERSHGTPGAGPRAYHLLRFRTRAQRCARSDSSDSFSCRRRGR